MATQKYFTYQPKPVAAAPLGQGSLANQPMTQANTLQLKPGQIAKFKEGEGWYAASIPKPQAYGGPLPGPQDSTHPTTSPAAAPPASSGGGAAPPAVAPFDFNNYINNDWETIAADADASKLTGEAAAAFQKQLRQAYIDYGGAGEDLGEWAQYIDAPTVEAAKQNKFSALALDRRNWDMSNARTKSAMAARGGLGSGDTLNALKNLLFAKEQADYGGLRTFQGGAVSGFNELGRIKQQALDMIRGARANAAARAAEAAPTVDTSTGDGSGTTAPPPPAAGGKYTWDSSVTNLAQLNAWLKARGKSLAQFKISNPAAYAKLSSQ